MRGTLTRRDDGENGDQRRERWSRALLDEMGVTEEKMKTLRREVRVKGERDRLRS